MKRIFGKVMVVCVAASLAGCAGGYGFVKEEENKQNNEIVKEVVEEDLLLSRIPNPEDFFVNAKDFVYYGTTEAGLKGVQVIYENSEGLYDRWKNYVDSCKDLGIWTVKDLDFDYNWSYISEDGKYKIMISCLENENMIDIFVTSNVK